MVVSKLVRKTHTDQLSCSMKSQPQQKTTQQRATELKERLLRERLIKLRRSSKSGPSND